MVKGIATATSVDVGYRHVCAVLSGGALTCWGDNALGELGDGTLSNSSVPRPVLGLAGVVGGTSGAAGACAVLTGGSIECWGDNETGELGIGTINSRKPYGVTTPVLVDAISNANAVSGGFLHTCALISGGAIDCWGYNQDGQVGNGTISSQRPFAVTTPVQVSGITNAVTISAGDFHTCALLPDGTVDCWGYIASSNIAGLPLLDSSTPVQIAGIHHAIAVSSGGFHSCALISNGTVECWGENLFGQLGDGTEIDSSIPVTVVGINNAVAIDLGGTHSCAVLSGGAVKCWGDNQYGQLGNGTTNGSSTPVSVVRPS